MLPPLPERMRPKNLSEYAGQRHLVGENCILRKMIDTGNLSSFILWGPPGVGKTTLAKIISQTLDREFFTLSAVSAGVKDVRDVIESARSKTLFSHAAAPILFIDEIHRFNKAQQDALLGAVEAGTVVLIGATTENPSFEVITPLLSRCQVFVLKSLDVEDLDTLLRRALKEDVVLKHRKVDVRQTEALFRQSGGDGRKLLNILEIVIDSQADSPTAVIDNKTVTECLQDSVAVYDKDGEMHYDIISAFIKSVRGSDPNAAVYWMARMLDGGEDPLFIARRLCILAAEDIGLANPNALLLADATFRIVHSIGMPEARIPLSECAIYLASSPKSNSAYLAIDKALEAAHKDSSAPVPLYLRNAPTKLMADLGYSDGYKYAHDYQGHFADQEYLPESVSGTVFYEPQTNRHEDAFRAYLENCWPKYYKK
ncbi:MAG: replication-associated recombination protein A [Bacteroides sp.]|nr:replication-associated recombination protein A [Bacteroidales bacterium]MCI6680312.1 replication-associated recombination protein A [Bacteroides sp.]MDD7489943.1 replication-associated recombination protein A [Bacteroides sp.]MDY5891223.1 replication-associated recombination protein A [Candidatus Cryptobacteroides sp.]